MTLEYPLALLALGAPPGQGQDGPPAILQILPQILLMIVIFYFLMIRPQRKKAKEHEELMKTIKAGDKVLISGGIVGVIVNVKEKTVSVRSADSKLEILKSAVTDITERASGAEASAT